MSQRTLGELRNYDALPEQVVAMAFGYGCKAVSFTYNEPTVFYEQMYHTVEIAKKNGLATLFHTNGTMNPEPLFALLQLMDAVTIDLKAFTPEFYQTVSSSELWPVLRTIQNVRKTDTHLELVNLMIPGKNDEPEDIRRMCAWIAENAGPETPMHFTRFFPAYKYQRLPPTPVETLESAAHIADEEGLQYVYIGNLPGHHRNSTFCPNCGETVIGRVHFSVFALSLTQGRCGSCDHPIPGVWRLDQAG
jgi:pyruvate formate lyase activating enzyme